MGYNEESRGVRDNYGDLILSLGNRNIAFKRIVVKAGTNVLTQGGTTLNRSVMESLASQIATVWNKGAEVLLVTSGAIAAGREVAPSISSGESIATSQMLAAIGQSRLMHAYQEIFSKQNIIVAQALLTASDVNDQFGYKNVRSTLMGLLERKILPIVNENDVVDTAEINNQRFGDNDVLSAIVAKIVGADLLLLLTDTDGLFTSDPKRDNQATLIKRVETIDQSILALAEAHTSKASRGGMLSKLESARYATNAGVTVIFAPGSQLNVIEEASTGSQVGTLFPAKVSKDGENE
tara:strand:+ start:40235 stop:41116 length:882 start_codon:yes stop_codon:yes gene_type:complete